MFHRFSPLVRRATVRQQHLLYKQLNSMNDYTLLSDIPGVKSSQKIILKLDKTARSDRYPRIQDELM